MLGEFQMNMTNLEDEAERIDDEISVVPSGAALGAEVIGVKIGPSTTERELRTVRDALLRHSVVVLRGQDLTPRDQSDLMDRLYARQVGRDPSSPFGVPGYPDTQIISNMVRDGVPIGISDAGMCWHSDTSAFPRPDMFVSLYAVEIPHRDGVALGNTQWLSAAAAFDALPPETVEELTGRRVKQTLAGHVRRLEAKGLLTRPKRMRTGSDMAQLHPAIRTHPITGRKVIYVNETYSEYIDGVSPERSEELIIELCKHLDNADFMFSHSWRVGDLVIWDNCATQHRATVDYTGIARRLHRCGSQGPVPE
jgi:taurine dioxygenase